MKKLLLLVFTVLFFCLPCFADENVLKSETGIVKNIKYIEENQMNKQFVDVEISSGTFKGEKVTLENVITGNPFYDILLKKKDRVILHAENADDGVRFFIADIQRTSGLFLLLGIFVVLVLIVGRKKGLMSLIATGLIICLVIWFLTPLILAGINPILATVLLCLLSASIAIYFVGGFNYKSTSAVLGTVLSLIFAAVLSVIVINVSRLTGFSSEETVFLFTAHPELNFIGILTSAMIIATLGAVIDIAMSIASTINEVFELNAEMTFRELFDSGMNVGKDIIGTMTNTLILVYLGSSLPLVLLSYNIDLMKFFNLNMVVTEIASALVGSIALVVCVPLTAVITAYFMGFRNDDEIELDTKE